MTLFGVLGVIVPMGMAFPGGPDEIWMYLFLMLVVGVTGLATWYAARRGPDLFHKMILFALGPDLFVVAGYSYLFYTIEDAFYPVALLMPIVYALVLTKRETWIVGALTGLAYMFGHYLGHGGETMAGALLLATRVLAVPAVSVMIATTIERRRRRETEIAEAVVEREQLNIELERRIAELQAVSQITEIIHSSLDFERVGPIVLEILAKVINGDTCCLFVVDKERSETLFTANIGQGSGQAAMAGPTALSADESFSCRAVFDHGNLMVLFCATAESLEALSEEDSIVLSAVASELVVAIENSRLYKLTKKLAITDELTGLNNYRFLQQRLDEEIERSRRYDKRMSLLMIDVDDFKRFNDSYGHIAGDEALAELGRVMLKAVREVDVVARYGGEEFSIVLPETDAAGAFVVAEKVREHIANHLFKDADGARCFRMSVSIGLATFPTHAWDKESLLREADDALYTAKNSGKDRVRTPARRAEGDGAENGAAPDETPGHTRSPADPDEWTESR